MNPHRKNRSSPTPGTGMSRRLQGGLSVAALVLIPLLAIGGGESFRAALDFNTGVLSLLSLTASIAWGLIATDRLLLSTRHRLLAQGIHRATAMASLGFLLLHGTVKVSLGHVDLLGALVPFGLGITGTSALIGFGSLAGFLMVIAATTGALRSALAGNIRVAGRWRTLHMLAYPAWCSALVHGLYTGRPAATWVVTMYCLALAGVAAAVSVRLMPRPVQRRIAAKIMSLTSGRGGGPAADEDARRDLSTSPLPGATGLTGLTGPADLNGRAGANVMNGMNGIPSQRQFEAEFQRETPLGQARAQPRRLAPPSPQLYEAQPPLSADPNLIAGSASSSASAAASGSGSGLGPGPGISAAYRAVSLAGDPGAPLAERVPMTEEIPVISETGPVPGLWPTPSPPPPAQAARAVPAVPPTYDTPPPPLFETAPSYDAPPAYGTAAYDATAAYEPPPSYETRLSYDTPSSYENPLPYGTAASYGAPDAPFPYDTSTPEAYDETAPMPGPLFPPPAGEPWNAPAGDRP